MATRQPLSDLPRWADRDQRGWAPIVIDFSTIENKYWPKRADDLTGHLEDIGKPLSREQHEKCVDTVTQRDIEETDGKRKR